MIEPRPYGEEVHPAGGDTGAGPVTAASISLPKGGGAIRGLGEKFTARPSTGTASLPLAIPASPGRSGSGPQLALSYDSGEGNGPYGLGSALSLPSITRKTDKGLPRYTDDEESDIFILSGAEGLVPVLVRRDGRWLRDRANRMADGIQYRGDRYRPRVEGLFARIERWTDCASGMTHWRSISRAGICTWYGLTAGSRIAEPENPTHVFRWLIYESHDDRGNAIVYEYKSENSDGVDMSAAHERNRHAAGRSANRYLKRVRYGNRTLLRVPYQPPAGPGEPGDWPFELVLHCGEHHPDAPAPAERGPWLCRPDPFSSYRSGFEIRTYRLCQRLLMFHHFADEPGVGADCLVSSMNLGYSCPRPSEVAAQEIDFGSGHDDAREEAAVRCFAGEKWRGPYCGIFDARLGPLGEDDRRTEFELCFPADAGRLEHIFLLCRYSVHSVPHGPPAAGTAARCERDARWAAHTSRIDDIRGERGVSWKA